MLENDVTGIVKNQRKNGQNKIRPALKRRERKGELL